MSIRPGRTKLSRRSTTSPGPEVKPSWISTMRPSPDHQGLVGLDLAGGGVGQQPPDLDIGQGGDEVAKLARVAHTAPASKTASAISRRFMRASRAESRRRP